MQMMAGHVSGAGMGAERGGGKDVLPGSLAGGIGIFAAHGQFSGNVILHAMRHPRLVMRISI